MVIPFRMDFRNGYSILSGRGMYFDLCYIDGGHDYESVIGDIEACYKLLPPNGALIGDDFTTYHTGVVRAVSEFVDKNKLKLLTWGTQWGIQRPKS